MNIERNIISKFFNSFYMPKPVLNICINYLVTHIGFFSLMPILAIYLKNVKNFSITEVATITFIFTFSYKSARFVVGPLIENIHPKNNIIIGCMISGLALSIMGIFSSVWMITTLLIISGVGFSIRGLSASTSLSILGDKSDKSIVYFANTNVFVNIASMIGPFIGSYLYSTGNVELIFPIIGFFYFLSGILIIFFLKSTDINKVKSKKVNRKFSGYSDVIKNKGFLIFLLFNCVGWFVYGQLFTTVPYYVTEFFGREEMLGTLYLINSLIVIFFQMPLSNLIIKKYPNSEFSLLKLSFYLFGISFLVASVAGNFYLFLLPIVIFSLAEMLFTPTVNSIVALMSDQSLRTTYFSFWGLSTAIGEGLGGFIGLQLMEKLGDMSHIWLVISLISIIFGVILTGKNKIISEIAQRGSAS